MIGNVSLRERLGQEHSSGCVTNEPAWHKACLQRLSAALTPHQRLAWTIGQVGSCPREADSAPADQASSVWLCLALPDSAWPHWPPLWL
jgi:hypothetical protein